jgi:hypothetical protein
MGSLEQCSLCQETFPVNFAGRCRDVQIMNSIYMQFFKIKTLDLSTIYTVYVLSVFSAFNLVEMCIYRIYLEIMNIDQVIITSLLVK